jgi:hypothetical protein
MELGIGSAGMLETAGSAAIVVAVVAALSKGLSLTSRGSMLAGAVASCLVTVIWAYAHQPIDWTQVPLQALLGWLVSMGAWTGGKVALTGSAGRSGKG